jgi:hypothetical protein
MKIQAPKMTMWHHFSKLKQYICSLAGLLKRTATSFVPRPFLTIASFTKVLLEN